MSKILAVDELTKAKLLDSVRQLGPEVIASHFTAWQLHGFSVPNCGADEVWLQVSFPKERPSRVRRQGVQSFRRTHPLELVRIGGVHVTTPQQTWLDLAMLNLSQVTYVACADQYVGRSKDRLIDLYRFVGRTKQVKGVRQAREALQLVRCGAESPKETEVRLRIVAAGLPEPELNVDVFAQQGGLIGRADMVFQQQRVIVEYDGAYHGSEQQRRKDASRLNELQHHGWRVLVLTQRDLSDRSQRWLHQLAAALGVTASFSAA